MICCSIEQKPVKIVKLLPDFKYKDRILQVFVCCKCGKITAELRQYCIRHKKFKIKKLSKRQLAKYVVKQPDNSWCEVKIEKGIKQRAGFIYGVNKVDKNGKIYQYAVDFNGVKTLVKEIT